MKEIFFLLLIILAKIPLYAQNVNFKWAKQMGGTDYEIGLATAIDASGNVYALSRGRGNRMRRVLA